MNRHRQFFARALVVCLTLGISGLGPRFASAASNTWTPTAPKLHSTHLVVGVDHATPKGHNVGFLDYFARTVTIHKGDTITWKWKNSSEPHTVSILPGGAPLTPDSANTFFPGSLAPGVPDADDTHPGTWRHFNVGLRASCGNSPYYPGTKPCSYDGKSPLNSGWLPPISTTTPPEAFTARINAQPGTYSYYCLIHGPSMSGTIKVVGRKAKSDTQRSLNRRAAAQYKAAVKQLVSFEAGVHPGQQTVGGHTTWTILAGATVDRISVNEMVPSDINIKPGDSVVWKFGGFHTVTFPNNSGIEALAGECGTTPEHFFTGTFPDCLGLEVGLNPKGGLPTGPSGVPYTGGYYTSGIMAVPKPHDWSLSFPNAGKFSYECTVHPGMDAFVTSG